MIAYVAALVIQRVSRRRHVHVQSMGEAGIIGICAHVYSMGEAGICAHVYSMGEVGICAHVYSMGEVGTCAHVQSMGEVAVRRLVVWGAARS